MEAQEEELITVDAVGCFEGEEEEEEEEVDVADDEDKDMRKEAEEKMLEVQDIFSFFINYFSCSRFTT